MRLPVRSAPLGRRGLPQGAVMQRIWLGSYPPGVAPDIEVNEHASVNKMLADSCCKYGSRPAFTNFGSTLSYRELDKLSRDFAAYLANLPGLTRGARVALMMPNVLQYPVALLGALRAGLVAVNVNPLYTARELEHQMRDSGAEAIVVLENFAHVVQSVLPNTGLQYVITTQVGDLFEPPSRWLSNLLVRRVKKMVPPYHIDRAVGFRAALLHGSALKLDEADPGHDDIAVLQYTGGTTGVAKGAILTHGNLVACVLASRAWTHGMLSEQDETIVTALPLYHVFSLTINCLFGLKMGARNLLITNPRDLPRFIRELRRGPFTLITGVNTLFNALLNTPGFSSLDFSHLKCTLGGGGPIHPAVAGHWRAVTGCSVLDGYGLTEAMPVGCSPMGAEYSGACLPFPSTHVSIRDDENRELGSGGEGEICVRGPQVTKGYWRRPEETQAAFTPDGWLRTGDIGIVDDRGYLRITDRKKDMIIVSGFKVFPNEVESVIADMPDVLECGVIGVSDETTGEAVKAFIKPVSDILSAEDVIAHCRRLLTPYKVPKLVEFRADLPKSPVGKVLRRELRMSERTNQTRTAVAAG
jgi:long-chain acyl-CoA synthetase